MQRVCQSEDMCDITRFRVREIVHWQLLHVKAATSFQGNFILCLTIGIPWRQIIWEWGWHNVGELCVCAIIHLSRVLLSPCRILTRGIIQTGCQWGGYVCCVSRSPGIRVGARRCRFTGTGRQVKGLQAIVTATSLQVSTNYTKGGTWLGLTFRRAPRHYTLFDDH